MLKSITIDISFRKSVLNYMLHQIKAPQFHTDLGLQKTVWNHLANVKIQGLFKVFVCFQVLSRQILFSRTFQDSPVYSSTFQACATLF